MARQPSFMPKVGNYSFDSLRSSETELIRRLRNCNLRVLRQKKRITPRDQQRFFYSLSRSQFHPHSLYISCKDSRRNWLGYGALVHIDWSRLECEVSSLLLSEFKTDELVPEFGRQFIDLHGALVHMAKKAGMRRVFVEVYLSRNYLVPLLSLAGFRTVDQRPHFYKSILGKGVGTVMVMDLR